MNRKHKDLLNTKPDGKVLEEHWKKNEIEMSPEPFPQKTNGYRIMTETKRKSELRRRVQAINI